MELRQYLGGMLAMSRCHRATDKVLYRGVRTFRKHRLTLYDGLDDAIDLSGAFRREHLRLLKSGEDGHRRSDLRRRCLPRAESGQRKDLSSSHRKACQVCRQGPDQEDTDTKNERLTGSPDI